MIMELVIADVQPGSEAAFEAGAAAAKPIFLNTESCHSFVVRRSIEKPSRYHLHIEWDSVEAHEHFRTTDGFRRWRELVGVYFAGPPVVEHSNAIIPPER